MSLINSQSFGIRFKTGFIISALYLLIIMQGCSSLETLVWNRAETTLDGHPLVIRQCRNSYQRVESNTAEDRHYIFGCENNIKVDIRNDVLTVNGKSYGTLNKGDSIVIKNDKVFINGREPVVVSKNVKGLVRNIEAALK